MSNIEVMTQVLRAIELTPTIDESRRNKQWAIKQLLGQSHTTVELI